MFKILLNSFIPSESWLTRAGQGGLLMRRSLSYHPQTTRHCNRDGGAFHLCLGGVDAVFLTAKPANFLGKAWTKVLEHNPPLPGFGGDLGFSSRKARGRGLVVLCPGAASMAPGALPSRSLPALGAIAALQVQREQLRSAARKMYFGFPVCLAQCERGACNPPGKVAFLKISAVKGCPKIPPEIPACCNETHL